MKIAGIIAEYNPFHEGHKYHIERTREITGADYVVVVMSGHFVQRGEPAVYDMFRRASSALSSGADAVFELPVRFAVSSAERFAYGGIKLLDSLGIDSVSFGSESDDINVLKSAAQNLGKENTVLKKLLKTGISFPVAYNSVFPSSVLSSNDILGAQYIKAISDIRSNMDIVTVKRIGSGHKETGSSERSYIYNSSYDFVSPDDMIPFMISQLSKMIHENAALNRFVDVSDEISDRIKKVLSERSGFDSYEEFISLIKTKNYSYSRISRALIHILLDIKDVDTEIKYAHLIGFNTKKDALLSELKKRAKITIISKAADYKDYLSDEAYAAEIYNRLYYSHNRSELKNYYSQGLVLAEL